VLPHAFSRKMEPGALAARFFVQEILVSSANPADLASVSRPMVKILFLASCLLAIVSWYTTFEGMRLYLSVWFSALASIGVQTALVLVAWLIGFSANSRQLGRRPLLIAVYISTAIVSVAFSYVSLYTWFSARERPAAIERRLYDAVNSSATQVQTLLTSAISEQQKHVLALEEMTEAEKTHGHISRAQDIDPYLAQVRAAVADEARTYAAEYKEGSGAGVRYSAFDRYTKLARQSLGEMQQSERELADYLGRSKPLDATENQLQAYRQVYDRVPWNYIETAVHSGRLQKPAVPFYGDFVDRTVSGQEDLLVAFQELFTAPTPRHAFALALAAFIDLVVFLLAFASGPYFFGAEEQRWISGGAALEGIDLQIFTRDFLRKLSPGPRGWTSRCSLLASNSFAWYWPPRNWQWLWRTTARSITCWSREFTSICWDRWRCRIFHCVRRR